MALEIDGKLSDRRFDSRLFLEERGDEFLGSRPYASRYRHRSTVTRSHPLRSSRNTSWRSARQTRVEEAHVALLVVREGAIVEVRGANCHPPAIDHHRLVVQHGAIEFLNLDAGGQQTAEEPDAVVSCKPVVIADPRDHDAHVHAAALGLDQCLDRHGIRNEVRIGDVDRLASAHDR